ncbi:DUF222 domain-containing protein [Actinomadura sp. 9N407]|uniref:DUF222 domain-containing protein n=1 Tax=Actinomadura sp. 9N407 TaxID=3375154 RepID=UPI0037A3DE4B
MEGGRSMVDALLTTGHIAAASEWEGRGWFPPGPSLAILLSEERLDGLSDVELIEVIAAARRQTAWTQARELTAIAELVARRQERDRRDDDDYRILSAGESLIEEIAAALTVTGNAAATLMHIAERLARSLPGTRAALAAGRIDLAKARVICDAAEGLPDHVAARLEQAALERAARQTTGQLRRRVTTLARRLAPDSFDEHTRQSVRQRRMEVWDNATGTAALALLDIHAEDAHAIHNKISAVAQALKADGDSRTVNQIRTDLALVLLRGHALPDAVAQLLDQPLPETAPHVGQPDGQPEADSPKSERSPRTGPQDDPPGIRQHCTHHGAVDRPGSGRPQEDQGTDPLLDGPGCAESEPEGPQTGERRLDGGRDHPVPSQRRVPAPWERQGESELIETLAHDAEQRLSQVRGHLALTGRLPELAACVVRAVNGLHESLTPFRDSWCETDEHGRHGHPGYRPPAALRRMIEARHPVCVFPTCNRRSDLCDLDHTLAYDRHGPTCACNLAPVCRHHHITKQTPGWHLFQPWPGLLIWITPAGTWHIVRPE